MFKNIIAVVLGSLVGSMANMTLILINSHVLYPMPEEVALDPEKFAAYVATLPTLAIVMVILAHLSQALVGAWVACRIGTARPKTLSLILGVLTAIGCLINLVQLPAPSWMWIEVPLCIVVALWVASIETARRAAKAA